MPGQREEDRHKSGEQQTGANEAEVSKRPDVERMATKATAGTVR